MLMDYVQGRNLNDLRKEQPERRFALSVALALLSPIVDALIYLHHQDPPIIHRDIKPGNIIVPTDGNGAMLVDFGTAKEYHSDATTSIVRQLTTGYAAPEQYMGGTDPRTDVYGLGATLYTLLSGQTPPDALLRATRSKGADPLESAHLNLPAVPVSIVECIRRAMSMSSDDRFETVEEFWRQLQAHAPLQQEQLSPSLSVLLSRSWPAQRPDTIPTAIVSPSPPRLKKHLVLLLAVLALFLTAGTGTGFLLRAANTSGAQRNNPLTSSTVNASAKPTPIAPLYPSLATS